MPAVCFYFQVHQPMRVKRYRIFDIGHDRSYFNDESESNLNNLRILRKVAEKSYLPANEVMYALLRHHPDFKISFSLSGIFLEQISRYAPNVLESFQRLVDTGRCEILSETYYHSLSFLYSRPEFRRQVGAHRELVRKLFGVRPTVFRNTELIYSNDVAAEAEALGYQAVIAEGADKVLGWRSPNYVYRPQGTRSIKLLLKNYRLSDDIAFRFSSRDWSEYPLHAGKFAHWISGHNGSADVINLFMDYETFGEHQWRDTGIFDFLSCLPSEIYRHPDNYFVTPSEAASLPVRADLDVPYYISWADVERDLSAWVENPMQKDAIKELYDLESEVLASNDNILIEDWRRLQTSDHFYYMCTKWFADGDVHKYFNPYDTPYDAFISYMNVLKDLKIRVSQAKAVMSVKPKKGLFSYA